MPKYSYRAIDAEDVPIRGEAEAQNAQELARELAAQGCRVSSIEELDRPMSGLLKRSKRLGWRDLALLNEHLEASARNGMPLAPALQSLSVDIRRKRFRAVLSDLKNDLEAGVSFSDAVERHENAFPPVYLAMLRAGERAGNLVGVFAHMRDYAYEQESFRRAMIEALSYPIMTVAMAVAVVIFLLAKVVPTFVEIFADFGGHLPGPTRFIRWASSLITERTTTFWIGFAVVILACLLVFRFIRRKQSYQFWRDYLCMFIPFWGWFQRKNALGEFSRVLGMLVGSDVPLEEGLVLAGESSPNALLRATVHEAADSVRAGTPLSEALSKRNFFPHGYCWLVGHAERQGEIADTMMSLASNYQQEAKHQRNMLMELVTPIVVVFIGFSVGLIIMSLYLPIFSLGDAISGQ